MGRGRPFSTASCPCWSRWREASRFVGDGDVNGDGDGDVNGDVNGNVNGNRDADGHVDAYRIRCR